jgi:hypothetical protein
VALVLIGFGCYVTYLYIREGGSTYDISESFQAVTALFFFIAATVPLAFAYARRLHPSSVDVSEDTLTLETPKHGKRELKWKDGPVDMAIDSRTAPPGKRRPAGLEAIIWVPVEGRDPGSYAVRPQELHMSGQALDEIKRRMEDAGFISVQVNRDELRPGNPPRRLAGTLWRFDRPPSKDAPKLE